MSNTPVPVSAESDVTYGPTQHLLLMMVGVPDLWDCAAPMNHRPGGWASRHSLTTNVKFNAQRIVLDGHDQGPLLTHLPIDDSYRKLKSNRKTIYSASHVVANGSPMACVNDQKFTMMACGDPISPPSIKNASNAGHNLLIGLSPDDELKGDVAKIASMITDAISFAISCAIGNPLASSGADLLGDFFGADPIKLVVGGYVGVAASIITSGASGWKEPITLKLEAGNGFRAMSHEVSYNPSTGEWAHKGTQNTVGIGKTEYGGSIHKPTKAPKTAQNDATSGEKL